MRWFLAGPPDGGCVFGAGCLWLVALLAGLVNELPMMVALVLLSGVALMAAFLKFEV